MRGFLRPLLVWLLLLSMPLQAWSAAAMAACGAAHARPALAGSTGGHGSAAPHHGAHRSAAEAVGPSQVSFGAAATHVGHAAQGTLPPDAGCSACAACFHGAGPPGAAPVVAQVRLRSPRFACAVVLPVQHRDDVPERPPRSRVA
jgi:hypothetical protein